MGICYFKNNKPFIDKKNEGYIDKMNKNTVEIKNKIIYNRIKLIKSKKNWINNNEHIYKSNPLLINYTEDLVQNSYIFFGYDNTFIVFYSDDTINLLYTNKNYSIIAYNIYDKKIINEIKNAHQSYISNFSHYYDTNNEKDLIISISNDNNLKLWDYTSLQCLLNLNNVYEKGFLHSVCFFNFYNIILFITSNHSFKYNSDEPPIIFDLNGVKIKQINDLKENTIFIDTFYDKNLYQYYIITGNYKYIKSYNYEKNLVYFKYYDEDNDFCLHSSLIINRFNNEEVKIIESSEKGNIRIWNFHTGELLKKINIKNFKLYGVCLWNDKYLFVGCDYGLIKLIDINNGTIIKDLIKHDKAVLTVKKIKHPKYGDSLISLSHDGKIKISYII